MSQDQDEHEDDGYADTLSFDPRTHGQGSERRFPLVLIFSLLLLLAIIAGIAFAYRGGVRQKGEGPAMVGQSLDVMKAAPNPADQPADPAEGLTIYHDTPDGAASVPEYAPTPEEPLPRPEAPVAASSTPAPAPVVTPPAPTSSASVAPVPAAQVKPAPVQALPAKPAASTSPTPRPVVTPPKAEPATAAPKPKPVETALKPAMTSSAVVQIGAFSSMAQAESGWDAAARSAGSAMAGKSRRIEPVEKDGQTLYRTSVVGFASKDEARALCDRLKSAGRSCFVR